MKDINRRGFLKILGAGAALAAVGCTSGSKKSEATASKRGTGPMTLRTVPTTGDRVSLLGFGCMRFPTLDQTSGRESDSALDQEEINRMVDYAIAHGVNYFDTSPAYCKGASEGATGIALSRHPREKYYIATKASNFAPSTWSFEASKEMYHKSMKELQVDYIDYYLLHGIGMGAERDGVELSGNEAFDARYIENGFLDFLLKEREAGRIRNLGFSYHGDVAVFDRLLAEHDRYKWDFVQIQMNYLDWHHAKEINERNTDAEYLYNELDKRGIPGVIMEPILGGRLANVNHHVLGQMVQRRPDETAATWAFRFCGTYPRILTVLSGMNKMEHLEENVATFSPLEPLSKDELAFLESAATEILKYPTIPCTNCKYCMPCPYGLDIPAIFEHYNRCLTDDNVPADSRDERYAAARRAFLVGYDRSVPRLRQADHCIACGKCVSHCPQRIKIPERMADIASVTEELRRNRV